jgi:hypothetical protein
MHCRVRHSPSIAAARRTFSPRVRRERDGLPLAFPPKLHRIDHQWKSRGTKTARPSSARIWTRPRRPLRAAACLSMGR